VTETALRRFLAEADAAAFEGWDFSFLDGRVDEAAPAWSFSELVRARIATPVLDMGTGGGEFFASFAPFPGLAVATEGWPPNVPVAARRLRPLDINVVHVAGAPDNADWAGAGGDLPFADESFALIVNRHESFSPTEVWRVLRAGGTFLTQQVGGDNDRELRERFGSYQAPSDAPDLYAAQLRAAGFEIAQARESRTRKSFRDVGAVAWYMKALPWDFPGFSVSGSITFLQEVHAIIERQGGFVVHEHRYLMEARKPSLRTL
jgi:SAM-dependent methyltransferase